MEPLSHQKTKRLPLPNKTGQKKKSFQKLKQFSLKNEIVSSIPLIKKVEQPLTMFFVGSGDTSLCWQVGPWIVMMALVTFTSLESPPCPPDESESVLGGLELNPDVEELEDEDEGLETLTEFLFLLFAALESWPWKSTTRLPAEWAFLKGCDSDLTGLKNAGKKRIIIPPFFLFFIGKSAFFSLSLFFEFWREAMWISWLRRSGEKKKRMKNGATISWLFVFRVFNAILIMLQFHHP